MKKFLPMLMITMIILLTGCNNSENEKNETDNFMSAGETESTSVKSILESFAKPEDLPSVYYKEIVHGGDCIAAIAENGDLYMWGSIWGGDIKAPQKIMSGISTIEIGDSFYAAITENGDLYTWGYNSRGQLGYGDFDSSETPQKIMSNVKEISLGYRYIAAITESGELYTWGNNEDYQLGNGQLDNGVDGLYSPVPQKIMSGVKEVYTASFHTAAITESGKLYMWGGKQDSNPKKIMDGVREVSFGGKHYAAITENGELYMWGYNKYGQLGNGTTDYSVLPQKVMDEVREVYLNDDYSMAITENGELYAWGCNEHGQLANGTIENSYIPQKIMSGVRTIDLSSRNGAAIMENSELYVWGNNEYGQLGNGSIEDSYIPQKIMSGVSKVSMSGRGYAILTENGDLYMWGDNQYKQISSFMPEKIDTPIKINTGSVYESETSLISEDEKFKNKNAWLKAYKDFLLSFKQSSEYTQHKFALAYIDDDNIPELILIKGNSHADGADIYTYNEEKVCKINEYVYGGDGTFAYLEKENLICSEWENKGHFVLKYFSIQNGKENLLAQFSDNAAAVGETEAVYQYNGKNINKSEYMEQKNKYTEKGNFIKQNYDSCFDITEENINKKLILNK